MSRRPRIAVNTAIYLHGTSGSATATRALVEALRGLDADVIEVSPPNRGGRGPLRNALADARWDLWQASRAVPDVDLLVSPTNIGFPGRARRHLLVVYDVMVFDRPDLFDTKFAVYFRLLVPRSVRRAHRVFTMSDHAASRLRRIAPDADVRVLSWPHPGGAKPPRVGFPERKVVLMVGATEPVKNHVGGIEAVARLRVESGEDIGLRVVGPAGRAEAEVAAALAAVDPTGSWSTRELDVPAEHLDAAYCSSWLLLQPSHDEGFGLPLVEAARHGLPAVHSGRGALPTVMPQVDAGGVTPVTLVAAMTPLLDVGRWAEVAAAAYERAGNFSPETFHGCVREHVQDLLPEAS